MSNRFAAGLGKLKEAGGKAQPPTTQTAAPSTDVVAEAAAKRFDQANRRGKVVISAYFDPAVRKQLAILSVEEERTQAALLAEGGGWQGAAAYYSNICAQYRRGCRGRNQAFRPSKSAG